MPTAVYRILPTNGMPKALPGLLEFVQENAPILQNQLAEKGAVLFRDFEVKAPQDFEQLALGLVPNLEHEYLGTSPREAVPGTRYVFSASELPPHYPIMAHCEMAYLPSAPARILFYCHTPPKSGGETPVCDFQAVWEHFDSDVRALFATADLVTIRNYGRPNPSQETSLYQLKQWDSIFGTADKTAVEDGCRQWGMDFAWGADESLQLSNTLPAVKPHPETGRAVWFNHTQVFHRDAALHEYRHIHRRQQSFRSWRILQLLKVLQLLRNRKAPDTLPMHVRFADGREIPRAVVQHIIDVIWAHTYFLEWQKGDVILLDNFRVAHGRLPYTGPRKILVAWSRETPEN